jgi:tetratricopeptide (TPR) repeat protein
MSAPTVKRRLVVPAIMLLLAGCGVAAYLALRPRAPAVPVIATENLDTEVAAAIVKAHAEVEAQPRAASTWGRLGMVLFAQDLYQESIGILAEAERLDPHDARWPYLRGLALILTQPDAGVALLQRAAELPPRSATMRLRLAEEYLKLDRLDEAATLLHDLCEAAPDNPRVLLGRGQLLCRRGQWQEALAPLQTAAAHPTAQRSAQVALAEAYARLGNAGAAAVHSKRAAATDADVPWADPLIEEVRSLRTGLAPRLDRAMFLNNHGQTEDALALINEVLRDHPKSDEAYLTRAKVLIGANRHDEAEAAVRQAIALNAELAEAHFLLGGIQMMHKDHAAAERTYLRTVALKPNHAWAHYLLGDSRLKQGNKAQAMDAFRDALRYRPDFALAQRALAALLPEQARLKMEP